MDNNRIRKLTSSGAVTTFAGSASAPGKGGGSWLDGVVNVAKFNAPNDIFYHNGTKRFFVADTGNHRIRMIEGGNVTTLAGGAASGNTNRPGTEAAFSSPTGVCTNTSGDRIYVADSNNNVIRQIILATREVSTFAGIMGSAGDKDGPVADALFNTPSRVAPGPTDDILYVSDTNNNKIKKIYKTDKGWVVQTVAGTKSRGSTEGTASGADGSPGTAALDRPMGLYASSATHPIVFVDSGELGCRVRIIDTIAPKPDEACRVCNNDCSVM